MPHPLRLAVRRIRLTEAVAGMEFEAPYDGVLAIFDAGGEIAGEAMLLGRHVSPEALRGAAVRQAGPAVWQHRIASVLAPAASPGALSASDVSAVVCTRDRPDRLRQCLDALEHVDPAPGEVVVVDSASGDDRTRAVCEGRSVRYVRDDVPGLSRARNTGIRAARGALMAFVDDDCLADERWLERVAAAFDDPLLGAVCGYVGPAEVETPGQYFFERHGGFARRVGARTFAATSGDRVSAGGLGDGNAVFRRAALDHAGGFPEAFGPGAPLRSAQDQQVLSALLRSGWRVRYEPRCIVLHAHRQDVGDLGSTLGNYAHGLSAHAAHCLADGELDALALWTWYVRHIARDLAGRKVPVAIPAREAWGLVTGLVGYARTRPARRRVIGEPPIAEAQHHVTVGREAPGALSIAIASRDRRARLEQVLRALGRQELPADRFEVVVVLDGATDGSAEMARTFDVGSPITVVEQPPSGLAAARNRGIRESASPIVCLTDDDIVPDPWFAAAHLGAHQAGRDSVVLGRHPPVLDHPGLTARLLRAWWEDGFRRKVSPGHVWTYCDWIDGNSSLPRALVERTGGFDEKLRGGRRQDFEYGARLLARGIPFRLEPRASGRHLLQTSTQALMANRRAEGGLDVALAERHPNLRTHLEAGGVPLRVARLSGSALEAALRASLALLGAAERAGLHGRAVRVHRRAAMLAYALGLADALPEVGARAAFVRWCRDPAGTHPVELDVASGAVEVPPGHDLLRLRLHRAGRPIGVYLVGVRGQSWDWDRVCERLATAADVPLKHELMDLLRTSRGEPDGLDVHGHLLTERGPGRSPATTPT